LTVSAGGDQVVEDRHWARSAIDALEHAYLHSYQNGESARLARKVSVDAD
jgi:superoxide dismutase